MGSEYKNQYKYMYVPPLKNLKPPYQFIEKNGHIDDITTNRRVFTSHIVKRPSLSRPVDNYSLPEQRHLTTSYNEQFLGTPGSRRQPVKPISKIVFKREKTKFVAEPLYKAEFIERQLPKQVSKSKETEKYTRPETKFEGESTLRSDFPRFSISRSQSFKPQSKCNIYDKTEGPFEDKSIYETSFPSIIKPARFNKHVDM